LTDVDKCAAAVEAVPTTNNTPTVRGKFWRRFFWTCLLLSTAFFSLLPLALELAAEKWLRDNGVADADVRNVDLNLFSGEFSLYGLSAGRQSGQVLHLGQLHLAWEWKSLWDRRVVIEKISLHDVSLDLQALQDGGWRVGGLVISGATPDANSTQDGGAAEQTPTPGQTLLWSFGLTALNISGIDLRYRDQQLESHIELERLRVGNVQTWDRSSPAMVEARLKLNGSELSLNSEVTPFSDEPDMQGQLKLSALDLAPFRTLLKAGGIDDIAGHLSVDMQLKARYHANAALALDIKGNVDGDAIQLQMEALQLDQKSIGWDGDVTLLFPQQSDQDLLRIDGTLSAAGTVLKLLAADLHIAQQALQWRGQVRFRQAEEGATFPGLSVDADIDVNALTVTDTAKQLTLAAIGALKAQGLNIRDDVIRLERLSADDSSVLKLGEASSATVVHVGTIAVIDAAMVPQQPWAVESIQLDKLGVDLRRNKKGQWWLIDRLTAAKDEAADTAQPTDSDAGSAERAADVAVAADEKPAIQSFRLATFSITGDSWIKFEDASVSPAYRTTVKSLHVKLTDLDSSAPQNPATLVLDSRIGKYGRFNLNGTLLPFAELISMDITGKLKSIDLPPFSSYTGEYLGYDLRRGSLDADIKLLIKDGVLDVNNHLLLRKFGLQERDAEKIEGLTQQLSMPLDAALDLLKDSDGNVALDLPVKGDINDPKFDPSGVINLAMGKALKMAAMSYVKNALQPLGTLIFVGELIGKATALRFQPLEFTPGEATIAATTNDYLDKIANMLHERPQLQLTLCGMAAPSDQTVLAARAAAQAESNAAEAQAPEQSNAEQGVPETQAGQEKATQVDREQLLALARQRGEVVKDYLVKDKGIADERLYVCQPRYDDGDDAIAGVDITL